MATKSKAGKRGKAQGKARAKPIRPTAWKPGQSGNPNGRPPDSEKQRVAELFRRRGLVTAAVDVIDEILHGGKSEAARLLAAEKVMERTEGKIPQPIEGTTDGPPVRVDVDGARDRLVNKLAARAAAEGQKP